MIVYVQQISKEDVFKLLGLNLSGNTSYYIQVSRVKKGTYKPYRNHGGKLFTSSELETFKHKYLSVYKLRIIPGFISL